MKASRTLIGLEISVCLGPLLVTLAMGLLLFPVWTGMLIFLATNPDEFVDGSGGWVAIIGGMVLAFLGIIGGVGVIRLYRAIWQDSVEPRSRRLTLWLVASGVVAVLGFNLAGGNVTASGIFRSPFQFIFLFALPIVCTLHLLYLARDKLFTERCG